MHQPLMSLRRFGAFLRSNAAASARDWQSQSPPARKCPFIPSWTLIDVPTTGSILIYSHFVQTVLTSRLHTARKALRRFVACVGEQPWLLASGLKPRCSEVTILCEPQ